MPADDTDWPQRAISAAGGLGEALQDALRTLSALYGHEARRKLEALRDETIDKFRNSSIPAEREMDHAKIAGPAIEAIEAAYGGVLRDLDH